MKVFSDSFVEKIIFDGKKAVGIEVKIKNKKEKMYASSEVILSAGSINSPQLLMVSGVGPSAHLKDKGIQVVHHYIPLYGDKLCDLLFALFVCILFFYRAF